MHQSLEKRYIRFERKVGSVYHFKCHRLFIAISITYKYYIYVSIYIGTVLYMIILNMSAAI